MRIIDALEYISDDKIICADNARAKGGHKRALFTTVGAAAVIAGALLVKGVIPTNNIPYIDEHTTPETTLNNTEPDITGEELPAVLTVKNDASESSGESAQIAAATTAAEGTISRITSETPVEISPVTTYKTDPATTSVIIAKPAVTVATSEDDDYPSGGLEDYFDYTLLLDGKLYSVYTMVVDSFVLEEDGEYKPMAKTSFDYESFFTEQNYIGDTERVTDKNIEKYHLDGLLQNALETDFYNGARVYSDGRNVRVMIRYRDFTDFSGDYEFDFVEAYKYQEEHLRQENPEEYERIKNDGYFILYDPESVDRDNVWLVFYAYCREG